MKKFAIIAMMSVAVVGMSFASAFAWDQSNATGTTATSATITCGGTAGETLEISLSPKVVAGYTVDNNTGTNDWYVIGTYHEGGTKAFATASSITKIWNDEVEAGETVSDNFAAVPQTPADAGSDDLWSDAGWSAL